MEVQGKRLQHGEELVRGRTFQLAVKGPWGGKELGNLWELKEPVREEDGFVIVLERKKL